MVKYLQVSKRIPIFALEISNNVAKIQLKTEITKNNKNKILKRYENKLQQD